MTATKAQVARWQRFQDIGCVPCAMDENYTPAEAHHVLSGGRRMGHLETVSICPWHHRGVPPNGLSQRTARTRLGPSKAINPREFRLRYGDDVSLLRITNLMLARVALNGSAEHSTKQGE